MRKFIEAVQSSLAETLAKPEPVPISGIGVNMYEHSFTVDGRTFAVRFSGSGGDYYTSFTGTDERGRESARLLGHQKPFRVFSGVLAAIVSFIHKKQPNQIEFCLDSGEVEERGSAYDRLLDAAEARGLMPTGYTWDRDGNHNYYIFKKGTR